MTDQCLVAELRRLRAFNLWWAISVPWEATRMRISGATIIDGTGRLPCPGTIATEGTQVSRIEPPGAQSTPGTLDVTGMCVARLHRRAQPTRTRWDQEAWMREPSPMVAIWTVERALVNLRSRVTTMRPADGREGSH